MFDGLCCFFELGEGRVVVKAKEARSFPVRTSRTSSILEPTSTQNLTLSPTSNIRPEGQNFSIEKNLETEARPLIAQALAHRDPRPSWYPTRFSEGRRRSHLFPFSKVFSVLGYLVSDAGLCFRKGQLFILSSCPSRLPLLFLPTTPTTIIKPLKA